MHRLRLLTIAAIAVCFMLSGCQSKPYYKFEGTSEAKKLVIYKKDGSEIVILLGSGIGGGLWKLITKDEVRAGKGAVSKEITTKDGVKFTLSYDTGGVIPVSVKNVSYKGLRLSAW